MVIIGLEDCAPCKVLRERNHQIPYIEISRTGHARTPEELAAKKLLKSGGTDIRFPQICNDDITELLPRDSLGSWN